MVWLKCENSISAFESMIVIFAQFIRSGVAGVETWLRLGRGLQSCGQTVSDESVHAAAVRWAFNSFLPFCQFRHNASNCKLADELLDVAARSPT
jgi:hypothetical protein